MSTPHADVDDADRLARVKLSSAIEPGDLRVTGLVGELGAVKVLDYLEAAGEVENHWGFGIGQELARADSARLLEQAAVAGIRFIIPGDPEWSDRLAGLRDAGALHERGGEPVGLWVRGAGDLTQLGANAVAVVGSRAATEYGMHQANRAEPRARGHGPHRRQRPRLRGGPGRPPRCALAGRPTIAVMPGGADRPYPATHAQLLEAIAERGLVVAEAPPGTAPTRARFLARNRIVAGLAEGTVVVEGAHPQRRPQHSTVD